VSSISNRHKYKCFFFNFYYKSKYWKFINLNKCSLTSIYHFSNDKDYLLSFNFTGNKQCIRPVRLLSFKKKHLYLCLLLIEDTCYTLSTNNGWDQPSAESLSVRENKNLWNIGRYHATCWGNIEMCQYAWCHNDVIKWGGFRKNAVTSMIFVSNISSNLDNYTVLSKFMKDISIY
jgi:hypothetical protein